jgi:hypothetical protein
MYIYILYRTVQNRMYKMLEHASASLLALALLPATAHVFIAAVTIHMFLGSNHIFDV